MHTCASWLAGGVFKTKFFNLFNMKLPRLRLILIFMLSNLQLGALAYGKSRSVCASDFTTVVVAVERFSELFECGF